MSICRKVTLHVSLENVYGANHGVVVRQHWVLSQRRLCAVLRHPLSVVSWDASG
jgi:hypothetical protein